MKKILCILLTFMLIISTFISCGSNKENSPNQTQQTEFKSQIIFKVELGIKNSLGEMEYVNIGEFWRAYDVLQERYITTVTLLEPMALDFEEVYKAAEGKDTITIGELMEHIQNKYGIFFKIGNTPFNGGGQ